MHPQIPLPLATVPSTSFDTFFTAASNDHVVSALQAFAASQLDESQIYLWGDPQCGKTHLLSATCNAVAASGYRVAYLPAQYIESEGALEGLEDCHLVCFDDIDTISAAAEV